MPRHVEKRLAWATERVNWSLDKWMTVIFSDKSRFTVEGSDGGEHVLRPVGKRGGKLVALTTGLLKVPI
jgi:hypothetical protein